MYNVSEEKEASLAITFTQFKQKHYLCGFTTHCSPVHHTDCFLVGRRVLPVFGIQRTLKCLQAVLRKLPLLRVRLQGAALEVSVNVGEYHLVTRGHNSNDEGQEAPVGDIDATIGVCTWYPRERDVERAREMSSVGSNEGMRIRWKSSHCFYPR